MDMEHAVPLAKQGDFFVEITPNLEDIMSINFSVEVGMDEEHRNLDSDSDGHHEFIFMPNT